MDAPLSQTRLLSVPPRFLPALHPPAATEGDQLSDSGTEDLSRSEHALNVERTRLLFRSALWVIPVLGVVDIFVSRFIPFRSLPTVLLGRLPLEVLVFLVYRRLGQRSLVSPGYLRAAELGIFGLASVTIALVCAEMGGIESLAAGALNLVLVAQTFAMPSSFRRGAARLGFSVGMFVATLGAIALFRPEIVAQLRSPRSLAVAALSLSPVLASAALLVTGGHALWLTRRELISTRNAGRYVLSDPIGRGGMGNVWKAYHPALRQDVAVKILRQDKMTPAIVARFEREINALTQLQHPNTVRVLDCGATETGLLYFVMELIKGETLKHLVRREGPLSPARAIHIVGQAVRALAEAHGRGIIHRDIKPDNILVTSAGGERDFVKVLDFGIAKHDGSFQEDEGLTLAGLVVGTPAFLSPEQARSSAIDARSDIYSLGAVLFFALTGRPPFEGPMSDQLVAHVVSPPPVPSEVAPRFIHPSLDEIVRTCLAKDPRRRYPTAGDLDAALKRALLSLDDATQCPPTKRRWPVLVEREQPTVSLRGARDDDASPRRARAS